MAGPVLGVVGAVVGSFFGMPQVGYAVGSLIGAAITPGPHSEGPRLTDRTLTTSVYGGALSRIYGTYRTAGEVIWSLPKHEVATDESAGKGGGPTSTTYSYFGSFALALGSTEIYGIRRAWANGKLVYDASGGGDAVGAPVRGEAGFFERIARLVDAAHASGAIGDYMTVHRGTESQLPDATIQAHDPDTSAYRGVAYVVFDWLPLAPYNNSLPNLQFEVVSAAAAASVLGIAVSASTPSIDEFSLRCTAVGSVDKSAPDSVTLLAQSVDTGLGVDTQIHVKPWTAKEDGFSRPGATTSAPANGAGFWQAATVSFRCPKRGYGYVSHSGPGGKIFAAVIGDAAAATKIADTGPDSSVGIGSIGNAVMAHDGVSMGAITGDSMTYSAGGTAPLKVYLTDGRSFAINEPAFDVMIESGYCYVAQQDTSDAARRTAKVSVYDLSPTIPTLTATVSVTDARFDFGQRQRHAMYVNGGDVNLACAAFATTAIVLMRANPLAGDLSFAVVRDFSASDLVDATNGRNGWHLGPAAGAAPAWIYCDKNVLMLQAHRGALNIATELGIAQLPLNVMAASTTTIAQIVTAECAVAGLSSSLIDVSELTQPVHGYMVSSRGSTRQAIEPLMTYGFFDAVEIDWVLKFPLRNRVASVTIPEDEMGAAEEHSTTDTAIEWTRVQELELPQEITVTYADLDSGYSVGAQYDRRLTTSANKTFDVQLPIAMGASAAAAVASRVLYQAWTSRNRAKWTVGPKWSGLMPSDAVYIEQGGTAHPVRITRREDLPCGQISFEGESLDSRVIVQNPGEVATRPYAGAVEYTGPISARLLDLPLLRDADDAMAPLIYAGATSSRAIFPGGEIYAADEGGVYASAAVFNSPTKVGTVAAAMPGFAHGSYFFDDATRVVVRFYEPTTLASVNRSQALGLSVNAALIGGEIIVYQTATLTGGTTAAPIYTLSNLLRGQRGTEASIATHTANEELILLDVAALRRVGIARDKLGVSRHYKALAAGRGLQAATDAPFTASYGGLRPLSPVHVFAGPTAAGDMAVTWTRRSRVDQSWRDFGEPALGESVEAYEIEILTSGGVLKRTITSATQTATFTAAQLMLDFGAFPASYSLRVYQLSSICGRSLPGIYTHT